MNATAVISLDNKLMSAVPNTAITSADGKDYIFLVSDKKTEDHKDEKSQEKHNEKTVNFERIEVVKGTSEMGYTAITPVKSIPEGTKIATKGAFFINAKLTNSGEHEH